MNKKLKNGRNSNLFLDKFFLITLLIINIFVVNIIVVSINKLVTLTDNVNVDASEVSQTVSKLKKMNLEKTDNLMIVAHPDDEILWGGGHLIEDNYLVICITCASREIRQNEFSEVMYHTYDNYISLGYPDRTNWDIDNWVTFEEDIKNDLLEVINYKEWDLIVTHNPDGEYGHLHHKLINRYVTNLSDKRNLYYFGKYYEKDKIVNVDKSDWYRLSDDTYRKKEEIENKYYPSQASAISLYKHIDMYENWIKASEWN